ncbi:MAG: flagellar basal body-associated FliL family protein [Acetobacteraceae bacterium]
MSAATQASDAPAEAGDAKPGKKSGGKLKLILLAIPILLIAAGAGLWFSGILPKMLGMQKEVAHEDAPPKPVPPSYIDLPELIANLNGNPQRPNYIKLVARLEVPKPEDVEKVRAVLPRLQDMMQTYMREMRPDELRGSAGTYRLREELIARANVAAAPAKVSDVLFIQMLIQ